MPAVWIPKAPKVAQQTDDASADDEERTITRAVLLRYCVNDSSPPAANSLRAMTVPEYQSRALSELLIPPGLLPPPGLTDTVEVERYNIFKPVTPEHLKAMLQCLSTNLDHIAENYVLASTSSLNDLFSTDEDTPKIEKTASESDLSTAASTDETFDETLSPESELSTAAFTDETLDETLSPRSVTKESVTKLLSSEPSSSEDSQSSGSEAEATEVAKEFVDPLADWLAKFTARPLWHRSGPDDSPYRH